MFAVFICTVISIIYIECIQYREKKDDQKFKKWDMLNCTTTDYTVRLNYTEEFFDKFEEKQATRQSKGKPRLDLA